MSLIGNDSVAPVVSGTETPDRPAIETSRDGVIRFAGLASLGAAAIHAAAIGNHADHRAAAVTFTVVAVVQLVWGALALVRPTRGVALVGIASGLAAIGGWFVAKSWGIWFISGLDVAEPVQLADGLAVTLALVATLLSVLALLPVSAAPVSRRVAKLLPIASLAVIVITVVAMAAAGTHVHGTGADAAAAGGHDHTAGATVAGAASGGADHSAHQAAVARVPYDPAKPIDLGGVPGVTPQQQAAAENLVAITVHYLPQWADPAVAEAAGFHSIGDGSTGVEHFVNEAFMDDDVILDPNKPESLVYDTTDGGRKLVAAMYMLKKGTPLDQVPNIGGALMQWHTHENLCYNAAGRVAGLTDVSGNCRAGLVKPLPTPMIHVWIEPQSCGPFAALEGIGAGTIGAGQTKLCDHVHGSS